MGQWEKEEKDCTTIILYVLTATMESLLQMWDVQLVVTLLFQAIIAVLSTPRVQ
jgi:hypothetical protein